MASALPSSRGIKRSGEPLVGENRISSLFRPELVSIFVRVDTGRKKGKKAVKEDIEYQIPCGLVRGLSEYFDKAFDDTFVEGKTGKIVLTDVKPWVIECFIGWLYTRKVFWEHQDVAAGQGNAKHQPTVDRHTSNGRNDALTNEALLDPATWLYRNLIELYIFADKYDTRLLRNKVIELITDQGLPDESFCVPTSWRGRDRHSLQQSARLIRLEQVPDRFAHPRDQSEANSNGLRRHIAPSPAIPSPVSSEAAGPMLAV
ncbi:hypothetical protein LTR56_020541 [Elasticomyces elasticus]|nr:hypothetical protein LTR56_020541 [Elasticomyces elasticus]KAK3655852.1 hypothetical protein LTR22_010147 [Elasticomyces elasticus]KAK4925810.1 hypothetical protein LTR49_007186 [Elasticomyces elasticus]KAK5764763.1 hypothetical protein LTS12_005032 [Elasticomyces elasticus]